MEEGKLSAKAYRFLWIITKTIPAWFWKKIKSRNSYEKALDTLAAIEEEYALAPWLVTLYISSSSWEGDGTQERSWVVEVGYDDGLYQDELEDKLDSYPCRVKTRPQERRVASLRNRS